LLKLINTIVECYDTVTERYGIHAHLTALGLKKALQKLSEGPEKDQYAFRCENFIIFVIVCLFVCLESILF
jgi:hypothetical protein